MRQLLLVPALALLAFVAAPATSLAGGFATVGLSSLPDDVHLGEAWSVDLTVLQHGRTPLDGVEPAVIIEPAAGGTEARFPARPTDEPGVYRARVVFPRPGVWRYSADDGFAALHHFGSVRVGESGAALAGPGSGSSDGGVGLITALGIAAAAGVLASLLVAPLRRRGGSRPAEA